MHLVLARCSLVFLFVAAFPAHANLLTYNFTVNGGSTGPLANVESTGYFSIDSNIVPPFQDWGWGHWNNVQGENPFSEFRFTWDGFSYTENNVNAMNLIFDREGLLQASFGPGCGADGCGVDTLGTNNWMFSGWRANSGYGSDDTFVYAAPDRERLYEGSGTFIETTHESPSVPPEPKPTRAAVFLDFESETFKEVIQTVFLLDEGAELFIETKNLSPAEKFSNEDRIADLVRDIFDRSELQIDVITDRNLLAEYDSTVTVEFRSPLDERRPGTLLGYAGNSSDSLFFPDQFDQKKDGTVEIYMSEALSQYPYLSSQEQVFQWIAEVVAHESGHAFGTVHIDPVSGGGEVMDYSFGGEDAEFWEGKTRAVHFGSGPEGVAGNVAASLVFGSHNPEYHIRRYALNESPDRNLMPPGTYDLEGIWETAVGLELGTLSTGSFFLSVLGDATSFGDAQFLTGIDEFFNGSLLTLDVPEGFGFSILGSSSRNSILDMALGRISVDGIFDYLLDLDMLRDGGLGLFGFDEDTGGPVLLSNVSVTIGETYRNNPDGTRTYATTVPAPSTVSLLLLGFVGLAFARRRNLLSVLFTRSAARS